MHTPIMTRTTTATATTTTTTTTTTTATVTLQQSMTIIDDTINCNHAFFFI